MGCVALQMPSYLDVSHKSPLLLKIQRAHVRSVLGVEGILLYSVLFRELALGCPNIDAIFQRGLENQV